LRAHDRYQHKPYTGSSHVWAIDRALLLPRSSSVLDVGPGSGAVGQALRRAGFSSLCAVEIDPHRRERLSGTYDDISATIDAFRGRRFDLVLLLDVIEHMADPFAFMRDLARLIRPGGTLLISVPNIAHWSIRAQLFFGRFEYADRGILDRTHLQFFTRRRLSMLLAEMPWERTTEMSATIVPLELILPRPIWDNVVFSAMSAFRLGLAKRFPGLFAFQHLAQITQITSHHSRSDLKAA
jgi:2-polyprenyl-3-methyl-5-hydroxy-6-metoxy-1,4-benzoquinol methylase